MRLAADLKDTLKQLEDKSAVLMQTQEEKEASVVLTELIGCVNKFPLLSRNLAQSYNGNPEAIYPRRSRSSW